MKERIKKIIFGYLPGFVLGVITAISISVIAATYFPSNQVTYDNTESGMNSDNVQTAIDELYNTCFPPKAGDQILEDQPLEKDPYECRYFFTGANPNNYVTFNGETAGWRIISVGCDGTIKIVRPADINTSYILAWDSSNSNNWARPASLNTYLNGTYLNSLSSEAQGQIVASDYSIGAVKSNNNISSQVTAENSKKWKGKIALPTLSEYLRTNSNVNCKTYQLYDSNYSTCRNTTWMYDSNVGWWTLSPFYNSRYVFSVLTNVNVGGFANGATYLTGVVRPTITLSSEVQITGGTGTESDPYTLG